MCVSEKCGGLGKKKFFHFFFLFCFSCLLLFLFPFLIFSYFAIKILLGKAHSIKILLGKAQMVKEIRFSSMDLELVFKLILGSLVRITFHSRHLYLQPAFGHHIAMFLWL